jgi:hypothetical protein
MKRRIISCFITAAAVTACALPFATAANATDRKNVLIVGDSVSTVLRWSPESMRPLWGKAYNSTLEVWGCQKLLTEGCNPSKNPSALASVLKHKNDNIDIVVVMTGYNDTGDEYLRQAIRKINTAVKQIGAELMWLTYRQNGNVRIKARGFNKVVRQEAKRLKMSIFDWDIKSRTKSAWFNGESVHMNARGGIALGRGIRDALDQHFQRGSTTTVAPATTVLDTTTTVVP